MGELNTYGISIWRREFRNLVVQALLASAVALFILAFLFPSFAVDYLRRRLGMMLDVFQTWFNITTVVDAKHKLTERHYNVLHDVAHQSDLLFLKIQRNTTNSLKVELWFKRVWAMFVSGDFMKHQKKELDYSETAVAHLDALECARRMWVSLWELSPEIGPQGVSSSNLSLYCSIIIFVKKHFGLPDSHFEPHSQLNNDFISAISSLGKAYYG